MKKNNVYLLIGLFVTFLALQACKKDDPASLGFKMKAVDTGSQNLKSLGCHYGIAPGLGHCADRCI